MDIPAEGETVVSQLHETSSAAFFYYTCMRNHPHLDMAANTSYADFPRLASLLARDGFLPRQMVNLETAWFSHGIVIL